ncbi:MAG TPA: polyprenyl synthetase family protein [Chitinophagales bacterium]|jgi:geranylgeranyl diphosphate synthase type II|nr:polyprenyl synthetase family protein [Chitinophagales bacterium]MBP6154192.1 polyprenyl synthetase family protein [Chitinophagales bacterium]HQV78673.1 polyprenyl synthetase family protein [Chitinophagales bacterium]HQW78941.1 polyprenyl synthetase family protein [Chitinophagales bacterium]HRB19025.1 polyprenyl synthetase family protein [Chitinophagales bacterium]
MHSIEEIRTIFSAYLNQESFQNEPQNLYEPNNYFLQIGGKRLRPCLLILATELFGGETEDALAAALAIEYFHNFTLIHDDVMDKAPLRRGFTTIHEKYNLNTAILSGDVLMIKACEYLAKVNPIYFKTIFDIYTKTAIEVCEGQQYDIDFETKKNVTQAEYIEMIRLKTAVLLAAAMKIGAILGHANPIDAAHLYQYADNLGIAFQIQDDILDCYGEEKLVGKQVGGDIIQNKKTLLLIHAIEKSSANQDETLLNILGKKYSDDTQKVEDVLTVFDKYNTKQFAIAQRDFYVQQSLKAIENINLSDDRKKVLKSLVDYLVMRAY